MEQKKKPNNKYITTEKDLKGLTRQVESKHMTDTHFNKAYEWFKRPAYHQTVEESNGTEKM